MTSTITLPKNTLYSYRGGGYDGCFWEQNFAFIDGDSNFHDVFSSGYAGIDNVDDLIKMIQKEDVERDRINKENRNKSTEHLYATYDLSVEDDRKEFVQMEAVRFSMGAAKWFQEHPEFDIVIKLLCDRCSCWKGEEFWPEHYIGAGGIVSVPTEMICGDCHSQFTCWYCNEYYENKLVGEYENDDGETIELKAMACEYCVDDIKSGRREG